jgi:hypothetical protein
VKALHAYAYRAFFIEHEKNNSTVKHCHHRFLACHDVPSRVENPVYPGNSINPGSAVR